MTREPDHLAQPPRIPTGVEGLDEVLCGGLLPGSVFIVEGPPGAGKTILANQLCFHHVRERRYALYFSLLCESHDRLIRQLQPLSFYDPAQEERIFYLSAYNALEREGAPGLLRLLGGEAKRLKASLIVLDGLLVLLESIESPAKLRRFFTELAALADMLGCTILLLTNSGREHNSPEFIMSDGWIALGKHTEEVRTYRTIEIHKYRRSECITGRHFFTLSEDGIKVYPRFERTRGADPHRPVLGERLPSGIKKLDEMIGGGIPYASTTLVVGPTGIGKTTFGHHFLSRSSKDQPGLLFGFYETEKQLVEKSRLIGLDLQSLIAAGALEVVWQPPTEHTLDQLAYRLIEAVKRRGVKRLFIDGVNAFEQSAVFPSRIQRFFSALSNELRALGVTTVCTYELPELVGGEARVVFGPISSVAQNILLLRYVELGSETKRIMNLLKVRTSRFDGTIREFHITEHGLQPGEVLRQAESLLTGHAHLQQNPQDD